MKSHLFQLLLLFLLLVDTTHSFKPPRVINLLIDRAAKISYGWFKDKVTQYAWNKTVGVVENQLPPPPPANNELSPPQPPFANGIPKFQELSQIKEYFYNFGYLQKNGQFDDYLDNDMVSAIKKYQEYFNLPVTGDLDDKTFEQITLPRCDVPDLNFKYSFYKGTNTSWPKGNEWFGKGTKNLNYGFFPESEIHDDMTKVFRDAFTRWSQTPGVMMDFTETTYEEDAHIKIGFYALKESFLDTVVGGSIISLQQSDNVNSPTGEMYLDSTTYWVLPNPNFSWSWEYGQMDLKTVAMHQIGHLLGYDHSSDKESIMYPIMPTQPRKVLKTDSDSDHNRYADSGYAAAGCFALFGSGSGLLTILSLGFAFMALLD